MQVESEVKSFITVFLYTDNQATKYILLEAPTTAAHNQGQSKRVENEGISPRARLLYSSKSAHH